MRFKTAQEAYDAATREPGMVAVVSDGFRLIDEVTEERLHEFREEFAYIVKDQSGRLMTVPVN